MSKDNRRHKDCKIRNFPGSIKELLCLLAKTDYNRVTVLLNTCEDCILENVEIVSVIGNMAVFRCHEKFKFVNICCICEVIVDCETILNEILECSSMSDC